MKKIPMITAIALAMCLCGCGNSDSTEEIAIPILETDSVGYKTTTAEITDITQKYYSTATLASPFTEAVQFSQSGQIKEVLATSGMEVKKGDLLCTLRTGDLDEQIDESKTWLDAAKETLEKLQNASEPDATEIEYAQIDVDLQQLQYDNLLSQLDEYNVYAPCDGTIALVYDYEDQLNVNSVVYGGQDFCSINNTEETYLCCTVFDYPLDDVDFGTKVTITQSDNEMSGKVTEVMNTGDDVNPIYVYMISCSQIDDLYDFGEANVCFEVYERKDVVVVPATAVKTISDRSYVNVLVDGVKVEQDVETGITNAENIEITSGLMGGEEIILN